MSTTVRLKDVVEKLDTSMEEQVYYLDKRTGDIVLLTTEELEAAEEDELISEYPDWQRESILKAREVLSNEDAFSELPGRSDVHEYQMMEDFCASLEDRRAGEELLRLIKGKGAFGRFNDAIRSMDIEDEWTEFKWAELEKIAIEWLDEQNIPYSHDDASDASQARM